MSNEPAQIDAVLKLMAVPDPKFAGIYVLGCFGKYKTLYSQQVRALNLIYCLHKSGKLQAGMKIAIVGGGAAGLTAAVAASRLGVVVTLLEKHHEPMGLQLKSHLRYLHPHIYDWPRMEFPNSNRAELRILDWQAGLASEVATRIGDKWVEEVRKHPDLLQPEWNAKNVAISLPPPGGQFTVSWNVSQKGDDSDEFDLVILSVGFGVEEPESVGHFRYWDDDPLDRIDDKKKSCLVLGCGDGALTDLMRLCIRNFRHEDIVKLIVNDPTAELIGRDLLQAEEDHLRTPVRTPDARRRIDRIYKSQHATELCRKIRDSNLLRQDTEVFLSARSIYHVYSSGSSILNRFIVRLLNRMDAWKWRPGPVNSVPNSTKAQHAVKFGDDLTETQFDIVVSRFGPKPALEGSFPAIWAACAPLRADWDGLPQHLDPTRRRMDWGTVFDETARAVSAEEAAPPRPTDWCKLVVFDLDGTLLRGPDYMWSWKGVWKFLNFDDHIRKGMMSQYLAGKKEFDDYKDWCFKVVAKFREKHLKRGDFGEITKDLTPVLGLREVLDALRARGIRLAIVSGGIDIFIDEVLGDYKNDFDLIHINRFTFDSEGFLESVVPTEFDFLGKLTAVKLLCEQWGFSTDAVAFVGDGFNDESVINQVGMTIGFCPQSMVMRINTDFAIDTPDLRLILPHILGESSRADSPPLPPESETPAAAASAEPAAEANDTIRL